MTLTPPASPDTEKTTELSPRGQEVEYALVLSRIIDQVKADPAQLRWAIYEVARARLKIDSAWLDRPERARLAGALETAIEGVEAFSVRNDDVGFLPPPGSGAQTARIDGPVPAAPVSDDPVRERPLAIAPMEIEATVTPILPARKRGTAHRLLWFAIAAVLIIPAVGLALINQRTSWISKFASPATPSPAVPASSVVPLQTAQQSAAAPSTSKVEASLAETPALGGPSFPLPPVFGVYALRDGALSELDPLAELVPDKRVAMSTPVTKPSRTTLPDGKVSFVVYRRDMSERSPDRFDIRVVARISRALTFTEAGKPTYTPIENTWTIRKTAYEFRVRPVPGSPGMLLVQPDKPDFMLPPGRYILVLKNQGYDFTVAGKITDPSQCLERTEATNGIFYSDCQRP